MNTIPPRLLTAYAITLKNPWAHLIAHYGKDIENRSWMPWEGVDTLLIHAGKSWDHQWLRTDGPQPYTSAIVAVADLAFACNASLHRDAIVCACGPSAQPGQCHWKLANVRALAAPVPANGRQGLWRPSPDDLAAVARQLTTPAPAVGGDTGQEAP